MLAICDFVKEISKTLDAKITETDTKEVNNLKKDGYISLSTIVYHPFAFEFTQSGKTRHLEIMLENTLTYLKSKNPEIRQFALVYDKGNQVEVYASDRAEIKENAWMIGDFDITPEIHYKDGKAVKVVKYSVRNGIARERSEYGLNKDGQYTEWHEDSEHGNWDMAKIVPRSRLEELSKGKTSIPYAEVLGKDRTSVEKIMTERKIKYVKHIEDS
ncbi:hypothetical protein J4206_01985 [Candidatus Woesearchaeota archaeon]|nr:hypothetical protein [Candidatus Woesearchaeota archaeon]